MTPKLSFVLNGSPLQYDFESDIKQLDDSQYLFILILIVQKCSSELDCLKLKLCLRYGKKPIN